MLVPIRVKQVSPAGQRGVGGGEEAVTKGCNVQAGGRRARCLELPLLPALCFYTLLPTHRFSRPPPPLTPTHTHPPTHPPQVVVVSLWHAAMHGAVEQQQAQHRQQALPLEHQVLLGERREGGGGGGRVGGQATPTQRACIQPSGRCSRSAPSPLPRVPPCSGRRTRAPLGCTAPCEQPEGPSQAQVRLVAARPRTQQALPAPQCVRPPQSPPFRRPRPAGLPPPATDGESAQQLKHKLTTRSTAPLALAD